MTCGRVSMVVGLVVGVVASPGRWLATRRTRCAHALRPRQAAAQGLPVARLVLARFGWGLPAVVAMLGNRWNKWFHLFSLPRCWRG